ncbi:unnamed protein product [Plutella xylostella]|uniref:(diamondback moth) hypothetical protein n=1 Tax=Plutella xylostella TaxID=51655 RepID=A0A8S4GAK6_PLUXY|nr:unnamed protein product [Plutella xylostella]
MHVALTERPRLAERCKSGDARYPRHVIECAAWWSAEIVSAVQAGPPAEPHYQRTARPQRTCGKKDFAPATMRITALVVLLACVACGAHARAQDEDRTPSRGLLKRGLLAKGKATTTTTTPAPQEEAEYEDEAEYPAEEAPEPSSEAPPSSTEGKKLGGVRPFRSNTDLLETLKRRRQQAAEAKLHGHSATTAAPAQSDAPTEAPVKANFTQWGPTSEEESSVLKNYTTARTNDNDWVFDSCPYLRPSTPWVMDPE